MSVHTVLNPATGQAVRDVASASIDETDAAVDRAVRAQRSWAALAPLERADALRRFSRVVEVHIEELAQLEVLEAGHPIGSARWEAAHVAQVLAYYAGAPERLIGKQ
ncbi:aldehyde dehydrogenase family protein, partial [Microbacterium sp.]